MSEELKGGLSEELGIADIKDGPEEREALAPVVSPDDIAVVVAAADHRVAGGCGVGVVLIDLAVLAGEGACNIVG